MIKINLASRKSAAASAPASSLGGLSPRIELSEINGQLLRAGGVFVAAYLFTNWWFDSQKVELLKTISTKAEEIDTKTAAIRTSLTKFKQYEEIKRALDTDEKLIKTKLDTIEKLSGDKAFQVEILKLISRTLPAELWLSSYKISQAEIEFQGSALDFSSVSDFMKRLSESEQVTDVQLLNTNQSKDEMGVAVATFEMKAKRKN